MKVKLKKQDYLRIKKHLLIDLSYRAGGTFNKLKEFDHIYDEKEAKRVITILKELDKQYDKRK